MPELPSLKGRYFIVGLCCDCWDRCNADRKLDPERRAAIEEQVAEQTRNFDKDDLADNRCPVCDENINAGIYVRVTPETLRKMRPI
jgi:hypothetical protein